MDNGLKTVIRKFHGIGLEVMQLSSSITRKGSKLFSLIPQDQSLTENYKLAIFQSKAVLTTSALILNWYCAKSGSFHPTSEAVI
jgi:hypothetical protein